MNNDTRALVAAAAFAFVTGQKVAGLYDHEAKADRRIAAESRGDRLLGRDGDRGVGFEGTLPELRSTVDRTVISMAIEGSGAKGYDSASASHYEARVGDGMVQVFDHGLNAWFSYEVQNPDAASSYYREG